MREVRDGLCCVNNGDGAVLMRFRDDLLYRKDNTGGVYGGGYRYNLGAAAEQGFKTRHVEVAVFIKVDIPQRGAGFPRNELPRNKVCVMVGNRNDYFIAGMELLQSVAVCNNIERFGRILGKHHLA